MNEDVLDQAHIPAPRRRKGLVFLLLGLIVCGVVLVGMLFIQYLTSPLERGGTEHVFTVEPGMSLDRIFTEAANDGFVRSKLSLLILYYLEHGSEAVNIQAGKYVFDNRITPREFLNTLISGEVQHDLVRLTLPEGISREQIAAIASATLDEFDPEEFLIRTQELEGQLFPDTYFVPPFQNTADLATLLHETFVERTNTLLEENNSALSTEEVIILASILEREANDPVSMSMVSGILQNRLEIDMPLQADATIEYVLDEPLGELAPGELAQNLRELDSPYNTYKYTGLPPTPIGNPGLVAIEAAINPTPSSYLFYITGTDGQFYYAETLAGHNQNINRYLR